MNYFSFLLDSEEIGKVSQSDVTALNNWSSSLGSIGQLFFYLACFVFVLFLAYYVTKTLSQKSFVNRNNSVIKIVESISIGYQMSIHLISVGDKSFLIGVAKDRITFLTELDSDSVPEKIVDNKIPFEKVIANYLNKDNRFPLKNWNRKGWDKEHNKGDDDKPR